MLPSNKFSGTLVFLLLLLLIYMIMVQRLFFPHKECLDKYQLKSLTPVGYRVFLLTVCCCSGPCRTCSFVGVTDSSP